MSEIEDLSINAGPDNGRGSVWISGLDLVEKHERDLLYYAMSMGMPALKTAYNQFDAEVTHHPDYDYQVERSYRDTSITLTWRRRRNPAITAQIK